MSPSLARATVLGVLWSFATTAAGKLVTLAGLAVLARLLAPEAFGLVASALVFIAYVETLGDLGTGMALIYWPSRREDAAQITFLFNLLTGLAWTALAYALAPAVGLFFHQPTAGSLLRALAWSFLIKSLGNTHDALVRKDLRFRARLIPESALAAVKAGVAIYLAYRGFGAWSLVWGQLAGLAARTLLLWAVCSWRPSFRFPRDLVGPMLAYGRGLVVVNVLAAIAHHIDLVIVGRMLGPASLGAYQMAYKVPELVIATVIWVTGKVLFPAFSRVNLDPDRLRSAYLNALRYVSLAAIPMAMGLFAVAEPLVLTFFGEQWKASIPILRALAVYAGLRALGSNAGDVLKASGRTGMLALLAVVKTAVLIPALVLGARTAGAVGVAATMAAFSGLNTLLNLGVIVRILGLKPIAPLKAVGPALPAAGALALVLALWNTLPMAIAEQLRLVGALVLGTGVYFGALHLTSPEIYRQARESLRESA